MNSRPFRNVRSRRNGTNYAESEEENERSRSPVSPRPPPRRRARITEDNEQEAENIVPTSASNEVVDNSQENQVPTRAVTIIAPQRRPRITAEQRRELLNFYMTDRGNRNQTLEERRPLATRLNLTDKQVSGWFNREQRRDERDRHDYMRRMGELDSDSELIEYRNRRREERALERESLVQSSSSGILAASRRNSFDGSILESSSNYADVMRRANEEHAATQFSESMNDQPGTSGQQGVFGGARRHRMVLHSSSPLFSDDEMAPASEIGSRNEAVNGQNRTAIEEVSLDRLGDLLRRARQDLDAIRASERSNEQPGTSAPRSYEAINDELDSMRRRFETSQLNISRSLWELPPPRRQIAVTDTDIGLNDIANTLNARSSRAVPSIPPRNYSIVPNMSSDSYRNNPQVASGIMNTVRELLNVPVTQPRSVRYDDPLTVTKPPERSTSMDPRLARKFNFSLTPNMAIPQEVLDSFGSDGLKDDDNEEITDIEEMVFQKLLRKKMVCEICMTHIKQFRCSECFYSMCKQCTDTIRKEHTGKTPCPHCRTEQKQFLPIILPRL